MLQYASVEEATSARAALHGTKWPSSNPKLLNVDFSTEAVMESFIKHGVPPPLIPPKKEKVVEKEKDDVHEKARLERQKAREDRHKKQMEVLYIKGPLRNQLTHLKHWKNNG